MGAAVCPMSGTQGVYVNAGLRSNQKGSGRVKLDKVLEQKQPQGKVRNPGAAAKSEQDVKPAEPSDRLQISSGPDTPITYSLQQPYWTVHLETSDGQPLQEMPQGPYCELADGDGPGVGGGYGAIYNMATPVPMSDGLLWHTSDRPQGKPKDKKSIADDDGDGPGLGGGYFTRPFKAQPGGQLLEEYEPPTLDLPMLPPPPKDPEDDPKGPGGVKPPNPGSKTEKPAPAVKAEGPSLFQGVSLAERVNARLSTDPVAQQRLELKAVEHYEKQFENLKTPAEFKAQTLRLQELAQKNQIPLEELRPQAYALARVAANTALGKRPYDSQVLGALCMDHGNIAQMGTGEGKTLTALMPLYLNALMGKGSHLVTVNDYLAQAGFDELKPAIELLGMKAGLVLKDMQADEKRAGYNADITYISNDTLGFDYLNDRTVTRSQDRVQREPFFALLDEADQVLLDEARVPLIIAGAQSEAELQHHVEQGQFFKEIVAGLEPGEDFRIDRKAHSAFLTEVGQDIVANEVGLRRLDPQDPDYAAKVKAGNELRTLLREEAKITEGEDELPPELKVQRGLKKAWSELLGRPTSTPQAERLEEIRARKAELKEIFPGADLYSEEAMEQVYFLQNALEARGLFREGRDYAVENGEVQIIDEFKGRISEGRRFTQGLHQALEIKEGLEAKPETHTVASITYPNLFKRYERIAGMTGTAVQAEKEFNENLGLNVIEVPPNKPSQRIDHPDRIFETEKEKFEYIANRTRELFEEGIPVLVPSISVEMNQYVHELLDSRDIPNQSLNAQDVKTNTPGENEIIKMAGLSGVVTSATNMAGRGVDIKPDKLNFKKLAMACDDARRSGKPTVVQLKDQEEADKLINWFGLPAAEEDKVPYQIGGQPTPEKVTLLVGDQPVPQGDVALFKGEDFPGKKLMILATERNLDRRIDDQLRGRAGRQGAPGETEFIVSLEDDLLRIYGDEDREKLTKLLKEKGPEAVRKYVDEAQQRVMNIQADGRLQTAKYDHIANRQREVIWGFRDRWVNSRPDSEAPEGAETMDVQGTVTDWLVEAYTKALDKELNGKTRVAPDKLQQAVDKVSEQFGGFKPEFSGEGKWAERLDKGMRSQLDQLGTFLGEKLADRGLPKNTLQVYQWQAALDSLDEGWKNQLAVLEDEKQASNLEAFSGEEPMQIYTRRCFTAFDEMWDAVKADTATKILGQMLEARQMVSQ